MYGNYSAAYIYLANSPLVSTVTFRTNTTLRMTTTRQHDYLNRLTSISSVPSSAPAISDTYAYNAANQRTAVTNADNSRWAYGYDALGQVISGKKYWSDQTPVAGQQFEYSFDDIGNRTQTKAGGDENGANLRSASYHANALNQYTNRDVPGYVDVKGVVIVTNVVTVNGQWTYRKGEYFRKELVVDNSSAALWTNITVAATGQTSVSGNVFVPKTQEAFFYDADGNLTNDGRWSYTWDAENRLTNMTSLSSAPTGSKLKLDFTYDWKSRRTQKIVSTNNGSIYVAQYTNKFVYDGWNLLAILDSALSPLTSFTWGLDLSGTMQGAGGVGGLLAVNDVANGVHFCAYDGNGNVMALVKAADGTVSANYEFGPFGELLRATGPMAKANPIRFSTKYQDDESDQVYYGYRSYNPSAGRWLSRDPVFELGFELQWPTVDSDDSQERTSTYTFVRNDRVDFIDAAGLLSISDILGLALNPPCGSVSVQGSIKLVNWHVTGIGLANKVPCNGIRLFLKGEINDALKQLPYSKTWSCKNGSCTTVANIGPLSFTLSPSVPLVFDVDLGGHPAPPAKPKCRVDLELSGTITTSGTIGYCCSNK